MEEIQVIGWSLKGISNSALSEIKTLKEKGLLTPRSEHLLSIALTEWSCAMLRDGVEIIALTALTDE